MLHHTNKYRKGMSQNSISFTVKQNQQNLEGVHINTFRAYRGVRVII